MSGGGILPTMSRSAPDTDRFEAFAAALVTYEDAPDECTIYPEDIPSSQRQTTWITAKEGSFCSAKDAR